MPTETEAFLAETLPRQQSAEQAIHNGDPEPRIALWSSNDPVTLFGAQLTSSGWNEVEPAFREVASWFHDSAEYEFEVIAAGVSGDLAYTVGYEHNRVTVAGAERTYILRVTMCTGARPGSGGLSTGTETSYRIRASRCFGDHESDSPPRPVSVTAEPVSRGSGPSAPGSWPSMPPSARRAGR